ncbi:hypothetical protein DLAC_04781 [Tieghemostelium lacteum]|uniref:Uncharacterized protein n=1 Tax=Tieghemostelium lacteum TaxID=361077 RepID=A0A151ZKM8_TIELA|nr:hypothetical protein DLAC_04781 [Tieghemostelium lacteum]|eukprot:KYQ94479.1 hypothetical protein DLAC_04781 [Tieghemostelium lacteum]
MNTYNLNEKIKKISLDINNSQIYPDNVIVNDIISELFKLYNYWNNGNKVEISISINRFTITTLFKLMIDSNKVYTNIQFISGVFTNNIQYHKEWEELEKEFNQFKIDFSKLWSIDNKVSEEKVLSHLNKIMNDSGKLKSFQNDFDILQNINNLNRDYLMNSFRFLSSRSHLYLPKILVNRGIIDLKSTLFTDKLALISVLEYQLTQFIYHPKNIEMYKLIKEMIVSLLSFYNFKKVTKSLVDIVQNLLGFFHKTGNDTMVTLITLIVDMIKLSIETPDDVKVETLKKIATIMNDGEIKDLLEVPQNFKVKIQQPQYIWPKHNYVSVIRFFYDNLDTLSDKITLDNFLRFLNDTILSKLQTSFNSNLVPTIIQRIVPTLSSSYLLSIKRILGSVPTESIKDYYSVINYLDFLIATKDCVWLQLKLTDSKPLIQLYHSIFSVQYHKSFLTVGKKLYEYVSTQLNFRQLMVALTKSLSFGVRGSGTDISVFFSEIRYKEFIDLLLQEQDTNENRTIVAEFLAECVIYRPESFEWFMKGLQYLDANNSTIVDTISNTIAGKFYNLNLVLEVFGCDLLSSSNNFRRRFIERSPTLGQIGVIDSYFAKNNIKCGNGISDDLLTKLPKYIVKDIYRIVLVSKTSLIPNRISIAFTCKNNLKIIQELFGNCYFCDILPKRKFTYRPFTIYQQAPVELHSETDILLYIPLLNNSFSNVSVISLDFQECMTTAYVIFNENMLSNLRVIKLLNPIGLVTVENIIRLLERCTVTLQSLYLKEQNSTIIKILHYLLYKASIFLNLNDVQLQGSTSPFPKQIETLKQSHPNKFNITPNNLITFLK